MYKMVFLYKKGGEIFSCPLLVRIFFFAKNFGGGQQKYAPASAYLNHRKRVFFVKKPSFYDLYQT